MIANNSSGAHVPVYGCTADHVRSLEVVLADGKIVTLGPGSNGLAEKHDALQKRVMAAAAEIYARMPPDLLKRWPGFGLDRFLRDFFCFRGRRHAGDGRFARSQARRHRTH